MPVSLSYQADNATLAIDGKFTFDIHRTFRQLTEQALNNPACARLDMDLSSVEYLDSSALGMLLLAREKASALNKPIRIKGARGHTLQILQVVKFDSMFELA